VLTTDNFSDVALLLSECQNVYSAEVPLAMKVHTGSLTQ